MLKSKEINNLKQEFEEKFQKEKDDLEMQHSNTKIVLAQTKTALLDLEDYVSGYKEQIENLT